MSLHFTAASLGAVFGLVTGLVGLWLRLYWRTRHECARRRTLVALALALRQGSELEERAADGARLRIAVGCLARGENGADDRVRRAVTSAGAPMAGGRGRR
jgi:hypothetical protein